VYVSLAVALVVGRWALSGVAWSGSAELHTLIEALTALLALLVGALALVGFYATRRNPLLATGAGFAGTAVLDGMHAALSAPGATERSPTEAESLVAWTWFLSRTFLALMLASRLRLSEETRRAGARTGAPLAFAAVGLLTMAAAALVLALPLPAAYHTDSPLPQPQEFVPAFLFLVALGGHLRLGAWRRDPFEDSLLLSMILGASCEALYMPASARPYDAMSDAAHLLKLTSYAVVLAGLLREVYRSFRESALEHEQRTFQFLEHLPVGVLVLNEEGAHHYANQEAKRLLGKGAQPSSTLVTLSDASNAYVIGSDEPYPTERMPLTKALAGEAGVVTDMELRRDEATVSLQMHAAPVIDRDGAVVFAIAAFQDVGDLRRAALEDPLTGLPNRAAFVAAFARIRALCERADEPLCVALLDIDHFKAINDQHGHAAGDEVLQRLAAVVPGLLRGSDVLARWGGEEFAVLLPRTPALGAAHALEKALGGFRAETFAGKGQIFRVTFSAGVVQLQRGEALATAVAAADGSLYRAKAAGRDRVCVEHEGSTRPRSAAPRSAHPSRAPS
jgi:diguanylate cyclase (GGDEF)-like protein